MKFASSELAYVEVAKSECYFWGDTNEAHFFCLEVSSGAISLWYLGNMPLNGG
jgi:hypothetical protein